ncbi:hypothetical protein HGRIS_005123 [Hohenbuehelia grisea]|uniref:Nitrogen regulatory protein areA GATA-like domain-containing protein n=1 Tax=Hohenbuehelia grisea TaxID=104357 RepID=A0ABR3JF12_9AGAR
MANYLPVLLVSVSTNAISDDSSVSTQPRAQVDYLSHEWQEEDVWRSWRNMTKQKNDIANGQRLENASWRTWWKQRNGLGTVSPETLNWLKDSDVTWLYGPLHTAIDWAPTPRSNTDEALRTASNSPRPSESDADLPSPVHQNPTYKPILKHRSISELLTSDLPSSPLFSPVESENEADDPVENSQAELDVIIEDPDQDASTYAGSTAQRRTRPKLMHTKSDTHVTRWGPSRLFRKDSPPRVPLPSEFAEESSSSSAHAPEGSDAPLRRARPFSATNLNGFFFDAITNPESGAPYAKDDMHAPVSAPVNGSGAAKKKHISFNTFVEQCIAIEKPKKSFPLTPGLGSAYPSPYGPWDGYDEGSVHFIRLRASSYEDIRSYDEDTEDGYIGTLGAHAPESDTDSEYDEAAVHNETIEEELDAHDDFAVDDGDDEDDDDDDDGVLHMRASSTAAAFRNVHARSQSKSSTRTSASNSSSSTSSSSSSGSTPHRRRNSAPTRRRGSCGLIAAHAIGAHTPAAVPVHHVALGTSEKEKEAPIHMTIAPIAPTLLKTASAGSEDDEDDAYGPLGYGQGFGYGSARFGWWGGGGDVNGPTGDGARNHKHREFDCADSPVELVYVPRVNSGFLRHGDPEHPPHLPAQSPRSAPGWLGVDPNAPGRVTVTPASPDRPVGLGLNIGGDIFRADGSVCTPPAVAAGDGEEDPYDYFGGPDLGEDFSGVCMPRRQARRIAEDGQPEEGESSKDDASRAPAVAVVSAFPPSIDTRSKGKERSISRSRSRSRSRTPSPACFSPSTADTVSSPPPSVPSTFPPSSVSSARLSAPPRRCNSFDSRQTSPNGGSTAMLSPPLRGRGASPQAVVVGGTERGRSAARTPSSSFSDRERSRSHSHGHGSPLGSLSPDGGNSIYAAYAGGRIDRGRDNERDRDRGRGGGEDRERGRPRTGRRLSQSTSPDQNGLATSPSGTARGRSASSPLASSPLAGPPASLDASFAAEIQAAPASTTASTQAPSTTSSVMESSTSASSSGSTDTVTPSASQSTPSPSPSLLSQSAPPKIASPSLVNPSSPAQALNVHCGAQGESDNSMVGRAANMVSSYLGLWQNGASSNAATA